MSECECENNCDEPSRVGCEAVCRMTTSYNIVQGHASYMYVSQRACAEFRVELRDGGEQVGTRKKEQTGRKKSGTDRLPAHYQRKVRLSVSEPTHTSPAS